MKPTFAVHKLRNNIDNYCIELLSFIQYFQVARRDRHIKSCHPDYVSAPVESIQDEVLDPIIQQRKGELRRRYGNILASTEKEKRKKKWTYSSESEAIWFEKVVNAVQAFFTSSRGRGQELQSKSVQQDLRFIRRHHSRVCSIRNTV